MLTFSSLVFSIGVTGMFVQILLLRELLIAFSGNELSIGFIFGFWLLWEACGSWLASKHGQPVSLSKETDFIMDRVPLVSTIFPLLLLPLLYTVRIYIAASGMRSTYGIGTMAMICAGVLFLPGLIHGWLMTAVFTWLTGTGMSKDKAVRRGYSLEAAGSICGGIMVTYLFIPYLSPLRVVGAGLLAASVPAAAVRFSSCRGKLLALMGPLCLVCGLYLLCCGSSLENQTITSQWGKPPLIYLNSFYQNIIAVKQQGQTTVYTDGVPFSTFPHPDIRDVEERVHIPALIQGSPASVLLLSGAAGGEINEILKYPSVSSIDYVERDPELLKVLSCYAEGLNDSRVELVYRDVRLFVKNGKKKYDLMLMNAGPPSGLGANRCYTGEFFSSVGSLLKDEGIFSFALPGSQSYYTDELAGLNKSILKALTANFASVRVLPGDSNIYLASMKVNLQDVNARQLADKLLEKEISTRLICPAHLEYRLDRMRSDWFAEQLSRSGALANIDSHPWAVGCFLKHWQAPFSKDPARLSEIFRLWKTIFLWAAPLAFTGLFIISARRVKRSAVFSAGTTGFFAMTAQLLIIFSHQVAFGQAYFSTGLFVSMLMGGMAAGSMLCAKVRPEDELSRVKWLEALIFIYCAALLFLLHSGILLEGVRFLLPALLFLAGLPAGMEFVLCARIFLGGTESVSGAGLVYAADMAGGFVSGMITGSVLIPLLGLSGTCLVLLGLKSVSALNFILLRAVPGR